MNDHAQVDFDALPADRDPHSMKWNRFDRDVLPYWVMDMDFAVPRFLREGINEAVDRGFLGYSLPNREMSEIFASWLERNHGWRIDPDWVVWLPKVVAGLRHAERAALRPGDSVMMHTPIYHPFRNVHRSFEPLHVDMTRDGDTWTIDFDAMTAAVRDTTGLLFLCNPQNPTCRVYTERELRDLVAFCDQHHMSLCVDEVHSLFVLDEDAEHRCVGQLALPGFDRVISLFSPSKVYNISGCACAAAVIPNTVLRDRVRALQPQFPTLGRLNIEAAKCAFSDRTDYVSSLLAYLRANERVVREATADIEGVVVARNEGTYNAFFDLSAFRVEDLSTHFQEYGLGLLDCTSFGAPTCTRLNFATPRRLLEEGLDRLRSGLEALELI